MSMDSTGVYRLHQNHFYMSYFKISVLRFTVLTALFASFALVALPVASQGHWSKDSKNYSKKSHHKNYNYEEETEVEEVAPTQSIVSIAVATPSLSTLVGAVTSAGLVDTLNGPGPFTVFAPNNDAFAKITVPTDIAVLTKILTYHVIAGQFSTDDLYKGRVLTTVNGQTLKVIKNKHGVVKLKSSSGNIVTILTSDVDATNGTVHIIDNVLLPK
jgi:uncharacterized surface protein with fasciclin (FAS1) repeats